MHELVGRIDRVVSDAADLEREFERQVGELTRLAFRVAYSVLRHREDAEDVAQDAVIRAHGKLSQLREGIRLRAWLVRMTWRLALDRQTSDVRRTTRNEASEPPAPSASPEDAAIAGQQSARLWTLIDSLSEKHRIVVVLCAMEGHDVAEVAALLDIPVGTVKRRLFDARQHLRERLR